MEKFGEKIKERRLQKKLSQLQLAEAAGTSKAHISRLERGKGKKNPAAELVFKLAKTLGTSMEYLVNDEVDIGAASFENEPVLMKIRMIQELNELDRLIAIAVIDSLYQKKMIADKVALSGDLFSLTTSGYMPY